MDMPALASLQREFTRALTSRESRPLAGIAPGGTLSLQGALDVYRTGYVVRLTEAMGETFEAVWSAVGDETFFRLCRSYILANPSLSYNLSDYGEGFPAFLKKGPEATAFPFLEELARFEWAFKDLFHAAEHVHAQSTALSRLGPGTVLGFGSAVRLLSFQRPVYALWRSRAGPRPEAAGEGPERLLLYKSGGEIYARVLEAGEFSILSALGDGVSIEAAMERVALEQPGFTPAQVSELFRWLWEAGVISEIK
jgi:hypothetical protein